MSHKQHRHSGNRSTSSDSARSDSSSSDDPPPPPAGSVPPADDQSSEYEYDDDYSSSHDSAHDVADASRVADSAGAPPLRSAFLVSSERPPALRQQPHSAGVTANDDSEPTEGAAASLEAGVSGAERRQFYRSAFLVKSRRSAKPLTRLDVSTEPADKSARASARCGSVFRVLAPLNGVMLRWSNGLNNGRANGDGCSRRVFVVLAFVDWHLRSASQVVLVNNSICGLAIWIALLVHDYVQGLMALMGCSFAIVLALLAGLNYDSIRTGLFGYNAVLVGCACAALDIDLIRQVALTLTGSLFSVAFSVFFGSVLIPTLHVPPLTLPFNAAILLLVHTTHFALKPLPLGGAELSDSVGFVALLLAVLRGVGQIFLAGNEWVGVAILGGMFVSSRVMALHALLGSAAGTALAFAVDVDRSLIANGIAGFNASLAAVAVCLFCVVTPRSVVYAALCATLSTLLAFAIAGATFTLPFCLGTLVVLSMHGVPGLVFVRLAEVTTPEEHWTLYSRQAAPDDAPPS